MICPEMSCSTADTSSPFQTRVNAISICTQ